MQFYGIDYISQNTYLNEYVKYGIIFFAVFFLLLVFVLYKRNHFQTKYRDLGILLLLVLLFMLGVEYSDYQQNEDNYNQTSQMVNFVKTMAKEFNISSTEIFVNSTELKDGVIVKIGERYFTVRLSEDQQSYQLLPTHLTNRKIEVEK